MEAIAERPTPKLEAVGLPPGRLPVDAVSRAADAYREGTISAERLIATVDRHGAALEREVARRAVQEMGDFRRTIERANALAGRAATRLAQLEWLRTFPHGPDHEAALGCSIAGGRPVDVADVLDALRAVQLSPRTVELAGRVRERGQRRGASPVMAALGDAGVTCTDLALELGIERRKTWSVLHGLERPPPGLQEALERLLGADQAAVVLAGIPKGPRAATRSRGAVRALYAAGVRTEDVAPLVPARPATVGKWLRGTLCPSPANAEALAGALEQLLGADRAAEVLALIPKSRSPGSR